MNVDMGKVRAAKAEFAREMADLARRRYALALAEWRDRPTVVNAIHRDDARKAAEHAIYEAALREIAEETGTPYGTAAQKALDWQAEL